MAYSVQDVLNDLTSVTHGTTVNKIPNVYGILSRAAREVLADVNPKETQKIVQLSQVFNNVFDYACPTDVKGDEFIDIRPQAGRKPSDIFQQGYEQWFDANKGVSWKNKIYTQWNTGIKTLRIEAPTLTSPITITDTSSTTGWTATSGAGNIGVDTINNVAGGGAITFDLAAGPTSGSIQISTLTPLNLTPNVNIDTEFYWVYLPNGAGITSLDLRWGSDITANYYHLLVTVNQQGNAFVNGWNLIAIPWVSATKVGTPVVTAFDSVQLIVNYNGAAQTGLKFCNLTSNTGYIFEAVYYSKYLFRDPSTNAFQEKVSDVTDINKILNLDTDSYDIYFNKVAFLVAQSLQGADAEYDANYFGGEDGQGGLYGNSLKKYQAKNPSESMIKGSSYYTPNSPRYGVRYPVSPYQQ